MQICLNSGWTFHEQGSSQTYRCDVPVTVQSHFIKAGILPDYQIGLSEAAFYAIEEKDWVFSKEFRFTPDSRDGTAAYVLRFDGIDTVADIFLNGVLLGRVQNMFVSHSFDVTHCLQPGDNAIRVIIYSALRYARHQRSLYPAALEPAPSNERCFIRKAQYAFGWDWGPTILSAGIWRGVRLTAKPALDAEKIRFATKEIAETYADVEIHYQDAAFGYEASVSLEYGGETAAKGSFTHTGDGLCCRMRVEQPRLWYPNGMGEQPLYRLTVSVPALDESVSQEVGIRTVQLRTETESGDPSFVFAVNGSPIFAKGACVIPISNLLDTVTREDYETLLLNARNCGMNMVRVWGGGIYEDDAFYRLCDELGLLVWQDFMYACAQYPEDLDWFIREAEREAEQVVLRLRNHPCMALWCGNNECNWLMYENWHDDKGKGNRIWGHLLPALCERLAPDTAYRVSSPFGGENPNSQLCGDRHNWLVWSRYRPYAEYRADTSKFLSEFGFQSMPCLETVHEYLPPDERCVGSESNRVHNKQIEGNERLIKYMLSEVGQPKNFDSFVLLSQYVQAEALKCGVLHWRSRFPDTAGALIWQLNDCYTAASWSMIDVRNRRKAAYHYARRFFAPVAVYAVFEDDTVTVYGIHEGPDALDASLTLRLWGLDGTEYPAHTIPVRLRGQSGTALCRQSSAALGMPYQEQIVLDNIPPGTTRPKTANAFYRKTMLSCELTWHSGACSDYLLFDHAEALCWEDPGYQVATGPNTIRISVLKPAVSVFVHCAQNDTLSDNCLYLTPGRPVKIDCCGHPGKVTLTSLYDMTIKQCKHGGRNDGQ